MWLIVEVKVWYVHLNKKKSSNSILEITSYNAWYMFPNQIKDKLLPFILIMIFNLIPSGKYTYELIRHKWRTTHFATTTPSVLLTISQVG